MANKHKPDKISIGKSIRKQTNLERTKRGQQRAVARFDVEIISPNGDPITHLWLASQDYKSTHSVQRDITGFVRNTSGEYIANNKEEGSQYVSKNSAIGRLLVSNKLGTYTYKAPKFNFPSKYFVDREITFTSRATFQNGATVRDLAITLEGQPVLRYPTLEALLKENDEYTRQLEEKRRQQEERERKAERLRQEQAEREAAIAKAEAEEAERLRIEAEQAAEELKRQEELRRQEEEEIRRLEDEKQRNQELISDKYNSFRTGLEMRVQEVADESQNQAKFSHLYDGTTLVIDGGPGTGKTTTSIQRLKLLIDPLLIEHESCKLTENQIRKLTDPDHVRDHWIFISPSDLLAQYLRSALSVEGLANDIKNVIPYLKFLSNNLLEYNITRASSGKKAPFAKLRPDDPRTQMILIKNGKDVLAQFIEYVRAQISKPFIKAATLKTSDFPWDICAKGIQYFCKQMASAKNLMEMARILQNLRENDQESVKALTDEMNNVISRLANRILKKIMVDEETVRMVNILFEDWERGADQMDDSDEIDLTEDEEPSIDVGSLEGRVFQRLKTLIKNLGIGEYDSSYSLKKKDREFYDVVKQFVDNEDLDNAASLSWFNRNFGSLCRGVEITIIRPLLSLYKNFRREQLKVDNSPYNIELLKEIISSNKNRTLHRDEQSFLLGFINTLMRDFRKYNPLLFGSFKHPFVQAYNRSVKYVIGIDEASDYSELDYWCIKSFAHPDYSSITLCGDIMQDLGSNGLQSWEQLRDWVFPNLDVFTLKTSYRQWPALLEVSQRMYRDDQGQDAPYKCYDLNKPRASAMAYVSMSEEKKIDWLAQHIGKVFDVFSGGDSLPSVAVFINEDEDASAFVEALRNSEWLENYDIEDCTNNKQGRPDTVRVFHLSKVKGLEFEAAFFHNIDGIQMTDEKLLRRHLYVGISRAVSHLGATFSNSGSDLLKYFKTGEGDW